MDQAPPPPQLPVADPVHTWGAIRRMTALLLLTWFMVTFLCIWFARELDQLHLFGWPVSFYMAAQGMMLIYLAIVAIYMRHMHRIDQLAHREQSHGE
jgi:putative solute:sodium symporter small subunit